MHIISLALLIRRGECLFQRVDHRLSWMASRRIHFLPRWVPWHAACRQPEHPWPSVCHHLNGVAGHCKWHARLLLDNTCCVAIDRVLATSHGTLCKRGRFGRRHGGCPCVFERCFACESPRIAWRVLSASCRRRHFYCPDICRLSPRQLSKGHRLARGNPSRHRCSGTGARQHVRSSCSILLQLLHLRS